MRANTEDVGFFLFPRSRAARGNEEKSPFYLDSDKPLIPHALPSSSR